MKAGVVFLLGQPTGFGKKKFPTAQAIKNCSRLVSIDSDIPGIVSSKQVVWPVNAFGVTLRTLVANVLGLGKEDGVIELFPALTA